MIVCEGNFWGRRGCISLATGALFFLCPTVRQPLNPQPQDINQGPRAACSRNILSRLQRGNCYLFLGGGEKAFKINAVTKLQKLQAGGSHVQAHARA